MLKRTWKTTDTIQQSLQSRYQRLTTENLTNTLLMLQAAEKLFHLIPKMARFDQQGNGLSSLFS